MFHNVLMTALTPLQNTNELYQWENRPFTTVWPAESKQEKPKVPDADAHTNRVVRRKSKRLRTAFTTEQLKVLEKTYTRFRYIDVERRRELAARLDLKEKSIKVWFQNRRMKEKRESSESSDSSSEVAREMTPPAPVKSEPVSVESSVKLECNSSDNESQYQFPIFQVQYPNQYYHENTNGMTTSQYQRQENFVSPYMAPTGIPFSNDNGVYPTYYYPSSANYSRNYSGGNYHYESTTSGTEYWTPNNFDLNYFQSSY